MVSLIFRQHRRLVCIRPKERVAWHRAGPLRGGEGGTVRERSQRLASCLRGGGRSRPSRGPEYVAAPEDEQRSPAPSAGHARDTRGGQRERSFSTCRRAWMNARNALPMGAMAEMSACVCVRARSEAHTEHGGNPMEGRREPFA
eukprot:ctg_126.g65